MLALDDLTGLFPLKQFCDSVIPGRSWSQLVPRLADGPLASPH